MSLEKTCLYFTYSRLCVNRFKEFLKWISRNALFTATWFLTGNFVWQISSCVCVEGNWNRELASRTEVSVWTESENHVSFSRWRHCDPLLHVSLNILFSLWYYLEQVKPSFTNYQSREISRRKLKNSRNCKQKLKLQAEIASRNCKQKLQAETASRNCKQKLQAKLTSLSSKTCK